MKKLGLLVMPLMAVSFLASCGNNNPQKDEYTVTEQERINAVSFKGTEYLQAHQDAEEVGEHAISDIELSPSVYHKIYRNKTEDYEIYDESYVVKNGADYVMYSRSSPTQTTWDESSTSSEYFLTIEEQGIIMLDYYNAPIQAGATYQFDKSEKCYWASFEKLRFSFYFINKKLTKFDISSSLINALVFSYKKITPTPPVSKNHL